VHGTKITAGAVVCVTGGTKTVACCTKGAVFTKGAVAAVDAVVDVVVVVVVVGILGLFGTPF